MIQEKYKKVIRDTFFFLIITTISFYVYNYYNPTFSPEVNTKLIIVTLFFGLLYLYLYFLSEKKIVLLRKVKNIGRNFIIFLTGFIFYSLFLNWIYQKIPFDEFIFFVLFLYVPISVVFGLEPRIPIAIALILIAICSFTLAHGLREYTDRISVYVYSFLVIGVVLVFIDSIFCRQKLIKTKNGSSDFS